jgi:hypothetical protein
MVVKVVVQLCYGQELASFWNTQLPISNTNVAASHRICDLRRLLLLLLF